MRMKQIVKMVRSAAESNGQKIFAHISGVVADDASKQRQPRLKDCLKSAANITIGGLMNQW